MGVAVADRVLILENAYYSVISPEGCAAILWKDRAFASNAAEALKLDANELLNLGIVDKILNEPAGGAHRDWDTTAQTIKESLVKELEALVKISLEELPEKRYKKFREMGQYFV